MNAKDFFMLVYKTREKQKEFYGCKNPYEKARLLNECKSLEKMLDVEIDKTLILKGLKPKPPEQTQINFGN